MKFKHTIVRRFSGIGLPLIFERIVRALEIFILLPIMLSAWGTEKYGEWLLVSSLPAIIKMSELGIGTAGANKFALTYFSGDTNSAKEIWITTVSLLLLLSIIILSASSVALFFANYLNWELSFIEFDYTNWGSVFIILLISRMVWFYVDPIDALYRTKEKTIASRWFITGINFIKFLAWTIFLVILSLDPLELAIVELFVLLISIVIYLILGLHIHRQYLLSLNYLNFKLNEAAAIIRIGLGYLMNPLWQALHFNGIYWIIKILLGTESVAVFGVARTLSRSLSQISAVIGAMHFPELQKSFGNNKLAEVRDVLKQLFYSNFIVNALALPVLLFGGFWILSVWLEESSRISFYTWIFLVFASVFCGIWWSASALVKSNNKPWEFSLWGTLFAVISLVVAYYGGLFFGLIGVAISCVFFEIAMVITIVLIAKRWLGYSFMKIFVKH